MPTRTPTASLSRDRPLRGAWPLLGVSLLGTGLFLRLFAGRSLEARSIAAGLDGAALLSLGLSGLAAALLLGWRRGRLGLPSNLAGVVESSSRGEDLAGLARWFLRLRWLAAGSILILTLVAVDVLRLLDRSLLPPLLACVALLAGANATFQEALRRRPASAAGQLRLQVGVDLVLLTAMLHFSGGIENPLSLSYLIHVLIAGVLFDRVRCFAVAGVSLFLFSALAVLEWQGVLPHFSVAVFPHEHGHATLSEHAAHQAPFVVTMILLQGGLLFASSVFTTSVMTRLRSHQHSLRHAAVSEAAARIRLERVVEAAGAGLGLFTGEGRCLWSNERYGDWLAGDERAGQEIREVGCQGGSSSFETRKTAASGRVRYLLVITTAMPASGREGRQVVQLVQDISARKEAELEALHASRLAALGELAGQIVHEVNNPLGVLSTRLRLLRRKARRPDLDWEAELDRLIEAADRIEGLSRSLLGFVRREAGPAAPVDWERLLRRVLRLVEGRARNQGVRLVLDCRPPARPFLGQEAPLEQVVLNLLLNALEAAPGGSSVEVFLGPGEGGRSLVLEVCDRGPGVPEELRERIFEPFFTTRPPGQGTGLGLSISRRIVHESGGHLQFRPREGGGACFRAEWPLAGAGGSEG